MSDLEVSKEKNVMKRFLKEVTKGDQSLALYGEEQVRKALEMGVVDTLLLSENLRKYRVTLKCPVCNNIKKITIDENELEDFVTSDCSKCKSQASMVIEEKIDLIDELSELAEKSGGRVILISQNSEEGDSLYSAFSGIAGISRYPIDI
jgi:peptide chain release factor subunit 1